MPDYENNTDKYRVEIKQEGRAGWVFYVEQWSKLPLPWEISGVPGVGISVPSLEEWDAYCEKQGANWAKGRREEILQRVAQGFLKQQYGNGSFEIENHWINISPNPSLISRLLTYFIC